MTSPESFDPVETPPRRKVFLETFGCQSNALESEHVLGRLAAESWAPVDDPADADAVLFNTCSIRAHAEDKVFSRLGRLASWKREREGRVVGVLGCMATAWKDKLLERAPHLDLVVGPDQYPKLPEVLERAARREGPSVLVDFDPSFFPEADLSYGLHRHKAFVEIMKGCDKFCTFCVVPFTRGREVSRPFGEVLTEVRRLVSEGVREVTLLGQNVNSYGQDRRGGEGRPGFPELLAAVSQTPGLARVRFTTSHPLDLSDDLVEVMAKGGAVCESLHLPVQCGSDRLLKRMNRKYTVAHYLDRVRALRAAVPDLALSTDLIVGFPGEDEGDFQATLDLVEEVRFDSAFSFKYSPRRGTPAARMLGAIPEAVKEERLERLNAVLRRHSAAAHAARVGRVEEVLVDGPADGAPGCFFGKTRQNKSVRFEGMPAAPGDLVGVRIESARTSVLLGTAVAA